MMSKDGEKKRGFVFTIIIVFLSLSLLQLSVIGFESGRWMTADRVEFENVIGAAYVFDDIGYDFSGAGGLGSRPLSIAGNSTHTWVIANFTMPGNENESVSGNISGQYGTYSGFLADVYSNYTHSNVTVNVSVGSQNCTYIHGGSICYHTEGRPGNRYDTIINWTEGLNESKIEVGIFCDLNASDGPYAVGFLPGDKLTINYSDPGNNDFFGPYALDWNDPGELHSFYPPGKDTKLVIEFALEDSGKNLVTEMKIPTGHYGEVNCTFSERIIFNFPFEGGNTTFVIAYGGNVSYAQNDVNRSGTIESGLQ